MSLWEYIDTTRGWWNVAFLIGWAFMMWGVLQVKVVG